MNAYSAGLFVHNSLRWFVLAAGVVFFATALAGWMRAREWSRADERLHGAFVGLLDLQMLAGLILYMFLSPLPAAFVADFGTGMKVSTLRFFMLDHPVSMFIAIAVIHVGRTRAKRTPDGRSRHRIAALTSGIGLLLILASIPWPGLRYGRPYLRPPNAPADSVLDGSPAYFWMVSSVPTSNWRNRP